MNEEKREQIPMEERDVEWYQVSKHLYEEKEYGNRGLTGEVRIAEYLIGSVLYSTGRAVVRTTTGPRQSWEITIGGGR